MASRLITPVLEEILKSYPLYSQDGKGKDRRLCGNILHRTRPLVRT